MDTLYVKSFRELDIDQLYALLKARHDVFVVEQHCPYPDLDGRDQDSLHLFYADGTGRVTAYMRMFPKADEPGTVRISRVLTVDRGTGLGGRLLQDGIRTARERLGAPALLGISNFSYGLARRLPAERDFLASALERGLTHPLLNPGKPELMEMIRQKNEQEIKT